MRGTINLTFTVCFFNFFNNREERENKWRFLGFPRDTYSSFVNSCCRGSADLILYKASKKRSKEHKIIRSRANSYCGEFKLS